MPEKPVLGVFVTREGTPPRFSTSRGVSRRSRTPSRLHGRWQGSAERAEWLRRPEGVTPELDGIDEPAARSVVARALEGVADTWLDPDDVRELLSAYGIPVVPERSSGTPRQPSRRPRSSAIPSS